MLKFGDTVTMIDSEQVEGFIKNKAYTVYWSTRNGFYIVNENQHALVLINKNGELLDSTESFRLVKNTILPSGVSNLVLH